MNIFEDNPIDVTMNIVNSNTKEKQKSRILRACEFCIKRKRKCDGGDPCSRCVDMRKECVYSISNKRGPKPKKKSNCIEDELALILGVNPVTDAHYLKRTIHDDFVDSHLLKLYHEGLYHFTPFGVPTREEVASNPHKQFWMNCIMVNAFSLSRNCSQALKFATEVEHFLNHYSFTDSGYTAEMGLGLLLLSNFREVNGEIDKAASHIELNYRLCNMAMKNRSSQKLFRMIGSSPWEEKEVEVVSIPNSDTSLTLNGVGVNTQEGAFRFISAMNLNNMLHFATDEDDVEYYYTKSIRLAKEPRDIYIAKTRYVLKVKDRPESVKITYELEDMMDLVAQSKSEFEYPLPTLCIIKALRCVCYMRAGNNENALSEARQSWDLFQKGGVERRYAKVVFIIHFIVSGIGMMCDDFELVSEVYPNMEQFYGMTELYNQKIEEVAAYLQSRILSKKDNNIDSEVHEQICEKEEELISLEKLIDFNKKGYKPDGLFQVMNDLMGENSE